MKYQQSSQGSQFPYPNHYIDPKDKNAEWCMKYARAAYHDFQYGVPKGVLANNQGDYEKFRAYAMGKQPVNIYKKLLGVDEKTNNTWLTIDWSVRPIVSRYRDRAIARLMKNLKGITASPIDMQAKAEQAEFYNSMKAKLTVRKLMMQTNPDLANHPVIALESGEPMDVEELEMRVEMGEQFNRAKDAEQAIELGFYENNYLHYVKTLFEDLFDFGIAGFKEWLGDDNHAKFRKVNVDNAVTSFCEKSDFSDMIHAGELIDVPLIELATKTNADGEKLFSEEDLEEFAASVLKMWGNPGALGAKGGSAKAYDRFKAKVLDIEFYTYDEQVYRDAPDSNGNPDFRKAEYNRGRRSDKYKRKCYQMVYKCKWIVGTDKCYDWGIAYDQKRSVNPKKKAKTSLSFKFYAYNFHEMKAQGFMERLIPDLDDHQLTILKIQNFKNRAVPSGWWIDLDGLERAAVNKSGQNMKPMELVQMFFETGVLLGRNTNADGTPAYQNSVPIIPISNTAASELGMLYQDLVSIIQRIESATGYNDATLGQANPKTLVAGYELANESTDDALFPLAFAENQLKLKLAEDVLCRMAQGVKKGEVTGYAPYGGALSQSTLMFIKISENIALREYGIMLQERTTDEQRVWLLQQMQNDIANGNLDTSDVTFVLNTHNIKEAWMILSYRVKKNKELAHQRQMELVQETNKGNQEAAMMAQQAKEREVQLLGQIEIAKKQLEVNGEIAKERLRMEKEIQLKQLEIGKDLQVADQTNATKIAVADKNAASKIEASEISAEASIEKQELANKKPVSTAKK